MSDSDARVVLVRHGETPWNRERRVQGWAPTSLTDRGRTQADAVGSHLQRAYAVDRIVSSDLDRCRETVSLVREHVDAPVSLDRAWRERHFGVYQGLDYRELFERFPEFSVRRNGREAAERRPENGESLLDARERVLSGWRGVTDSLDAGETVLVVTHGGPLYAVLGHVRDLSVGEAVGQLEQDNCAVNELRHDLSTGETVVRLENDTAYRDAVGHGRASRDR